MKNIPMQSVKRHRPAAAPPLAIPPKPADVSGNLPKSGDTGSPPPPSKPTVPNDDKKAQ